MSDYPTTDSFAGLAGWTPVGLDFSGLEPHIDWADLSSERFVDPFFGQTVTRWAASGRITSIRTPGGHRRFRESEVRALLRGDAEPAAQGHLTA